MTKLSNKNNQTTPVPDSNTLGNSQPMSRKKLNKLIAIYFLVVGLIGIGPLIYWLSNRSDRPEQSNASFTSLFSLNHNYKFTQRRISLANKVLIRADNSPDKQAGVVAFAQGDFATAIDKFSSSLQMHRNDPEGWIYLSNAKAAQTGNAIKIATIVPIGGNLNVSREILRGVAQAQYEVNNTGGIGGKLLQVEIANDDNNPEVATQIATALVKDASIVAAIGHNSSDASIAAAPIYQQGGLVMISPTSVARNLSGIGSYVFRTTPSARFLASTLASYAVIDARKTNIAICSDTKAEASKSFKEEFIAAVFEKGGKITNTNCDFAAADFDPEEIASQAISDGADSLFLAPSVDKLNQAVDVARANKGRLPLLGSHTMYAFDTLQQGQADFNGMVLAVAWHPEAIPGNQFALKAKKFWGGAGSWRTAMAYDATVAAIAGLKSGNSREQLQKALSNSGFSINGATGRVKFLPTGDRNTAGTLVKIRPGKISGTGYDFAPFKP